MRNNRLVLNYSPENDENRDKSGKRKKSKKPEKVTWDMIRNDFDRWHPHSKRHVVRTEPADAGVLRLFMDYGLVLLHYYDTHCTVPDFNYMEKMREEEEGEENDY